MIVSEQVYCTDDVADWVLVGVQKAVTPLKLLPVEFVAIPVAKYNTNTLFGYELCKEAIADLFAGILTLYIF